MTVSTVVAGLLPIMWSTRVGAEVMKPLATPVLGGMISSLIHVLIVTPVIFFSIHERRLGIADQAVLAQPHEARRWRLVFVAVGALTLLAGALAVWTMTRAGRIEPAANGPVGRVVTEAQAGEVRVVVLSPTGTLRQGANTLTIEFRSGSGELVDVGSVSGGSNMAMPGMVMSANVRIAAIGVPGRYRATAEFGMAGAWPLAVEWNGPAGRGSVTFEGIVQ